MPAVLRNEEYLLYVAITGGVLLLVACIFVIPRLIAPQRTPESLAHLSELSDKDRIQLIDESTKLKTMFARRCCKRSRAEQY